MPKAKRPEKPHVSYSQLNLFGNCPEAYRRRYLEGEIIPPGVAALRGRAVHGAGEANHRQKLGSGRDLPLKDLVDIAATRFDEAKARDGFQLTPEEMSAGVAQTLGRAKDSAVKLTGLYADKVAPAIDPELVEERVRIELPESPVDMLSIIDVATKDRRVKDLKTAARSKTQTEADSSLQLSWYAMAYQVKTGQAPAGLDLEVLVDTVTPKHQRLSTVRGRRDFEVLVNRINVMLKAVEAGSFPPANVGHFLCSTRWCGYAPSCPYFNAESERRAAAGE